MLIVDSGELLMFDHVHNDGDMWTGKGEREVRRQIRFQAEFTDPPRVMLSVQMIDGDAGSNLRLDLRSLDIDTNGFTSVAKTWSDTKVGRLRVTWIALGQGFVDEEDSWRL